MDIKNKIILILSLILLVGGIIGYMLYMDSSRDEKIKQNQYTIDSLQKSLANYKKQNDSLSIVATTMQNLIQNQEVKVIKVKESFIVYKTPEIKNSSDAYQYINKFIME
jgi:hypothetical protein